MIIRHPHQGYPERRNILNNKWVQFKQAFDLFKIICHLTFKLLGSISQWALNLYWHPFQSSKSKVHLFNGICLSSQQWVCTFETSLPRLGRVAPWIEKMAVKKMAQNNCLQLIALSNCNYHIQRQFLVSNYPSFSSAIMAKTMILHPPQHVIFDQPFKKTTKPITFTFVGNQFFGKGGREILFAFKQLNKEGYNFRLNIISNFTPDGYASHTINDDVTVLKSSFKDLPDSIKILEKLPNNEVLKILKNTHVALMPTYADTYGYFVLEAQACGCPVITTDIRALPEINNNECGWVIKVPKDKNGNGILETHENRERFSNIIEAELYRIVKGILETPEIIVPKAKAALKRIKQEHDPERHAQKLVNIYELGHRSRRAATERSNKKNQNNINRGAVAEYVN